MERYAQCLANGRGNQLQCWCETADNGPLPQTAGRQVSASRAASKVADRVLYLKAETARKRQPPEPLDAAEIAILMNEIGDTLLSAARALSANGHEVASQRIRKSAITHAGRSLRTAQFVEEAPSAVEFDFDGALARLALCDDK